MMSVTVMRLRSLICFFFFNDTATTEIYTLSLHDALPICIPGHVAGGDRCRSSAARGRRLQSEFPRDRKSTRLNSSHGYISYAVFCLKKKNPYLYTRCSYLTVHSCTEDN